VVVELRLAPLPLIGALAVHCWFVVTNDAGRRERWEVWQTPDAGGTSVGHVHRDLKGPDEGVGGGPARTVAIWEGDAAVRVKKVLEAIEAYPHCRVYRYWPGPNSNTFAAWVLRQAGIEYAFPWKAFGARFGRSKR
jgi:Protein of unknown function (DUF3750)